MADTDLGGLANKIKALTPPQKLRLAADLLDHGRKSIAHSIIDGVATELGAALALEMLKEKPDGE